MKALQVLAPLVVLLAPPTAPAEPGAKTLLIVRHAEAEPESVGPDRKLTADGTRRAGELARVLGTTPIAQVITTGRPRSRLTAEPLVRATRSRRSTIETVDATVTAAREAPWGSTTVIVGHSNTIPEMVAALTGQPFPAGLKVTHDLLLVVTLPRSGEPTLVQLRYGAPDTTPGPGPSMR